MSLFEERLDEYLGTPNARHDIRAMVRRAWFYDFDGYPIRMWQGQGKLHTADGNTWLGTVDAKGNDIHKTPRISDARDGTSPSYTFSFGYLDEATYEALDTESWRVAGRSLTYYRVLFRPGEGLRPDTPIAFGRELTMMSTLFNEDVRLEGSTMVRRYVASVLAKDGNSGRSMVPGRTYTDTSQREYARQLGVETDRGCEFVALLANRVYQVP